MTKTCLIWYSKREKMKTPTILLLIISLFLTSCQSINQTLEKQEQWAFQSFTLPVGFKGQFHIFVDKQNGIYSSVENGVVSQKIPDNRILLIKEWAYNEHLNTLKNQHTITHQHTNGTKISWMPQKGIGLWVLGGWVPEKFYGKHGVAGLTGFFGTKEEAENYKKLNQ